MDLPNIERGMAIMADQINRIMREVRSNELTSVEGGRFQRSTGGTSIQIDKGFWGSGAAATLCPFECTDASENGIIKVQVAQNTVNVNTGARWPQGMGVGFPDYKITITQTSYFYVKLVYVTNDVIVKPDEDAITIAHYTTLKTNTVDEEYVLIAIVEVADGAITKITNQCENVTANPCNLKWN